MGKRVRVQLFGFQKRSVQLDADATEGSRVGTDLLWPDGSTVEESEIRNTAGGSTTSTSTGDISEVHVTLWSLILGIPAIIKSLAALATDGWIRNEGGTVSASKWAYNKTSVSVGEELTIPTGCELIVFSDFTMDGDITLDGDLVILT